MKNIIIHEPKAPKKPVKYIEVRDLCSFPNINGCAKSIDDQIFEIKKAVDYNLSPDDTIFLKSNSFGHIFIAISKLNKNYDQEVLDYDNKMLEYKKQHMLWRIQEQNKIIDAAKLKIKNIKEDSKRSKNK